MQLLHCSTTYAVVQADTLFGHQVHCRILTHVTCNIKQDAPPRLTKTQMHIDVMQKNTIHIVISCKLELNHSLTCLSLLRPSHSLSMVP